MTLKLYTIPESLYCAKTRILLRYKNLEWEEHLPPGGYGSDEYKQYVPSGNLPALCIDDFILADSEAIAEYLEEKHPTPSALPDHIPIRAKVRELSRFHDTRLEPAVRKLFVIFDDIQLSATEIEQIEQQLNNLLIQLNQILNTYLSIRPNHLTLADCGYAVTFLWLEKIAPYLGLTISMAENITLYRKHIEALPTIQKELQSYTSILENFLKDELASP